MPSNSRKSSRPRSRTGEPTMAEREYQTYATAADNGAGDDADVLLDVPVVKVDRIHLAVEELDAHVALKANVLDLVRLNVGVTVHLGKVEIDIEGVEAQALLKVRLDRVAAIVDRALTTIDRNPELIENLGRALEEVGSGAGDTLGGAGEALADVGEGAGQAVGHVGQTVGELGQGAGQAVGGLGRQLAGAGETVSEADLSGPKLAREAAKVGLKEATEEAKELGAAASRKVMEMSERHRRRRAERSNATPAALREAEALGLDLDELEGSGADGRITVRDVREAVAD